MRHRQIYLGIVLLLILAAICFAVSNPSPIITVKFNETVTILSFNLTDSTGLNRDISFAGSGELDVSGNKQFYFRYQTNELLDENKYNFTVMAMDSAGNTKQVSQNFTISYTPLDITIINPPNGVTNFSAEDIILETNLETEPKTGCRYSTQNVKSSTKVYEVMALFNVSSQKIYTIKNLTLIDPITKINVRCNTSLYKNPSSDKFLKTVEILIDKEKPVITSADVLPKLIFEDDIPLKFNLSVTTNELTTCWYVGNENEVGTFGNTFNKTHKKQIEAKYGNGKYSYNVTCKDRVGYESEPKEITFEVNTDAPMSISLASPLSWVSTSSVDIVVDTSKKSDCTFTYNGNSFYTDNSLNYKHTARISLPEGISPIEVECIGEETSPKQTFSIKVDRTVPSKVTVNDTSNLAEFPEYSFSLDSLTATFRAYDNVSGIAKFNYSILEGSTVISSGEAGAGSCSDNYCTNEVNINSLSLKNNTKYKIRARAIDNSGLISSEPAAESNGVTIDTSKQPKEKTPPIIKITKQRVTDGVNVTVSCQDTGADASGCDIPTLRYGRNAKRDDCKPTREYENDPIFMEESEYFCAEAKDKAGNLGTSILFINTTETNTRDEDNDGILLGTDNCPTISNKDQKDTDKDNIGDICDNCPSVKNPSQKDTDSDKVGDECDKCSKTAKGTRVDKTGCPTSGSSDEDSDNDGMPDDWETDYGLDPDDPDDADLDLDKDGVSNYEEYVAGTDPTDKTSFPKTTSTTLGGSTTKKDTDKDGMDDDWEKKYGLNPNDASDAEKDLDGDGLTNSEEYLIDTYPDNKDSDEDGYDDKKEDTEGTDPMDANSYPEKKSSLGVIFLILIILIVLGVLGFLAYLYLPQLLGKKEESFSFPSDTTRFQPPPATRQPQRQSQPSQQFHTQFQQRPIQTQAQKSREEMLQKLSTPVAPAHKSPVQPSSQQIPAGSESMSKNQFPNIVQQEVPKEPLPKKKESSAKSKEKSLEEIADENVFKKLSRLTSKSTVSQKLKKATAKKSSKKKTSSHKK